MPGSSSGRYSNLYVWSAYISPFNLGESLLLGGKRKHPTSPVTLSSMNSSYPDREVSWRVLDQSHYLSVGPPLKNGKSSPAAFSFGT